MTTISYTSEENLDPAYVTVQWSGLAAGDDGQPFDCRGLKLASMHYWGDFASGSGKITLMASNQLSPVDFGEFMFSYAPRLQMPENDTTFLGSIKPVADASFVSGGVALIFVPGA